MRSALICRVSSLCIVQLFQDGLHMFCTVQQRLRMSWCWLHYDWGRYECLAVDSLTVAERIAEHRKSGVSLALWIGRLNLKLWTMTSCPQTLQMAFSLLPESSLIRRAVQIFQVKVWTACAVCTEYCDEKEWGCIIHCNIWVTLCAPTTASMRRQRSSSDDLEWHHSDMKSSAVSLVHSIHVTVESDQVPWCNQVLTSVRQSFGRCFIVIYFFMRRTRNTFDSISHYDRIIKTFLLIVIIVIIVIGSMCLHCSVCYSFCK